jgi:hypothetical protein
MQWRKRKMAIINMPKQILGTPELYPVFNAPVLEELG